MRNKNVRLGLFGLFVLVGLGIAVLMALMPAGATQTGDVYPGSGDWTIDNPTRVIDEIVDVDGDIVINARLELWNATIRMDLLADGQYGIEVTSTGNLMANDSLITSTNPSREYYFRVYGPMTLKRVTVEETYNGVRVLTDDTVLMEDSNFIKSFGTGLYLLEADGTTLRNIQIQTNEISVRSSFEATSYSSSDYQQTHVVSGSGGAMYIKDGNPKIEDVYISANGSIDVKVTLYKYYYYFYMYLHIYFPMVGVDSADMSTISGIHIRDSLININVDYQCYDKYTYSYQYWYMYTYGYATAVNVLNYGDVELKDCDATNVKLDRVKSSITCYSDYATYTYAYPYTYNQGMTLFGASVSKRFSTAGPHKFKVTLKDAKFEGVGVLSTGFSPDYNGTLDPTFETIVIIDNVTLNGGNIPFKFNINPVFSAMKTVYSHIRISNSTFTNMTGYLFEQTLSAGPGVDPNRRTFDLYHTVLIENNLARWNRWSYNGWIYTPYEYRNEYNNLYEKHIILRDNVIRDNTGSLWYIYGNYYTTRGYERFTAEGNYLINNTGTDSIFDIYYTERFTIKDNQFIDHTYSYEGYFYDMGGHTNGRKPCKFIFDNNTFLRCNAGGKTYGLFYTQFGGELRVVNNNITHQESAFIDMYAYTYYSGEASLYFQNNTLSYVNGTGIYFNGYSYHEDLTCYIDGNTLMYNNAPFTDYYIYYAQNYNYDATTFYRNNTAIGCTGDLFKNYGKLTITDNFVRECEGYVFHLDYLGQYTPKITGNRIVDCQDVYYIGAKARGMFKMSLAVSDLSVDCTGNAFYLKNVDCTMNNVSVTPRTRVAIIADESNVDAMSSSIPIGSGQIIGSGEINVWYELELDVEWTNLADPFNSSGVRVAEALIVFYGKSGAYYSSAYTDKNGHLDVITVPQWSLKGSFLNVWSPYTVSATKSGVTTQQTLDLTRSYTGEDSLFFLLKDPYVPVIRITSPFEGDMFAAENVTLRGFSSEVGSGIGVISVAIGDGEWTKVSFDENGDFMHKFSELPEGDEILLRARVNDIALNHNETSVTVKVDRTPPMLEVQYPEDGITVNEADLLILGEYEPGATIAINGLERKGTSGTLQEPFTLSEGFNVIVVMATDPAGNSATVTRSVRLDRFAPTLTVLAPRDGLVTSVTNITVEGDAEEGTSVTISVMRPGTNTIDEKVTLRPDGIFVHKIDLEEGKNTIIVKARDTADNTNSVARVVYMDTSPPLCQITSPAEGTVTNVNTIRVIGTAEVEGVTLYLNGKQVFNTGTIDRMVSLNEGENVIELKAVDRIGNDYRDQVTVILDTQPPVIVMERPLVDYMKTSAKDLLVKGKVEGGATKLTIMGNEVSLGPDGTFETTVTMPEQGENEVLIVATDRATNAGTHSITVDYSDVKPMLAIVWQPGDSSIVSQSATLFILGTTTPGVEKVTITHQKGDTEETATAPVGEDGTFNVARTLLEGDNTFTVSVTDDYGNTNATTPYTVNYKYKPPKEDIQESEGIEPAVVAMWLLVFALIFLAIAIFVTRAFRQRESQ